MSAKTTPITALPMHRAPTMRDAALNLLKAMNEHRTLLATEAHSVPGPGANDPNGERLERHKRVCMMHIDLLHGVGADYAEIEPVMALLDDLEAVSNGSTPASLRPAPGAGVKRRPPLSYSVMACRAAAAALADHQRKTNGLSVSESFDLVARQLRVVGAPPEYFECEKFTASAIRRWRDEANQSTGAMGERGHKMWRELREIAVHSDQTRAPGEGAHQLMRYATRGGWLKECMYNPLTPRPKLPG